jgi:glucuronate isomerase
MLYSQASSRGAGHSDARRHAVERDHRRIWRIFCENFHLFSGHTSAAWLAYEFVEVFGLPEKPHRDNADALYDALQAKLALPEFRPRALFERFRIEALCTTHAASDPLEQHKSCALRAGEAGSFPVCGRTLPFNSMRPAGEPKSRLWPRRGYRYQLL